MHNLFYLSIIWVFPKYDTKSPLKHREDGGKTTAEDFPFSSKDEMSFAVHQLFTFRVATKVKIQVLEQAGKS